MDVEVGLEEEDEGYEPEDIILYDNGSVIFDKYEFQEIFNCIAAQFYEGILYVLDRDTKKWRNVEDEKKAPNKLKTVQRLSWPSLAGPCSLGPDYRQFSFCYGAALIRISGRRKHD